MSKNLELWPSLLIYHSLRILSPALIHGPWETCSRLWSLLVGNPVERPPFKASLTFISSVQLLNRVRFFANPWTTTRQASLPITSSWSLVKLMSIESVMPSSDLILCCPLLLPPSVFPIIRVFANESALHIRWPKYWSLSISPYNEYSGLISFRTDWSVPLMEVKTRINNLTPQLSLHAATKDSKCHHKDPPNKY